MKLTLFLAATLAACFAQEAPLEAPNYYSAEVFAKCKKAGEIIDPAQIDSNLLSAAIFHETNTRRQKEGVPLLREDARARAAARMQAEIMAVRGSVSHVNPGLTGKETVAERFQLAGLGAGFSAENVATAFGMKYSAGEAVHVRMADGKKVFSREKNGLPIEAHTYLSFSEALLNQWMASPGHRANIISAEAQFFGAACQPAIKGMALFYCAQEFYAPLPSK